MKQTILLLPLLLFLWSGCQNQREQIESATYLRWVGDSEPDKKIDDPNFEICHTEDEVFQYFNLMNGPQYVGEKKALEQHFMTNFKPLENSAHSGFVRVRFIVNCEGKAGRFRVIQSDLDLNETKFDSGLVKQLVDLTKSVEKWVIQYKDDTAVDYYQYLIFKIDNGRIIEILP